MILDGVVDSVSWYNGLDMSVSSRNVRQVSGANFIFYCSIPPPEVDMLTNATYDAILSECLTVGPDICLLARDIDSNLSSQSDQVEFLRARVQSLKESLSRSPIVVDTTILSDSSIDLLITALSGSKGETHSLNAASSLHLLLNRNGSDLTEVGSFVARLNDVSEFYEEKGLGEHEALRAITCGDIAGPNAPPDKLEDVLRESKVVAQSTNERQAVAFVKNLLMCANWPYKSKEKLDPSIFQVDGGLRTRNPILIIGNTYDITTPIKDARSMNNYLADSVLLERRGFGVSYLLIAFVLVRLLAVSTYR